MSGVTNRLRRRRRIKLNGYSSPGVCRAMFAWWETSMVDFSATLFNTQLPNVLSVPRQTVVKCGRRFDKL